jgi:hypothetical protein
MKRKTKKMEKGLRKEARTKPVTEAVKSQFRPHKALKSRTFQVEFGLKPLK